jgi:hypothetical protein
VACIKTMNDIVTQPSASSARQAVSRAAQMAATPVPYTAPTAPSLRIELNSASQSVTSAHRAVRQATSVAAVQQALTDAANALDTARRRGASASELRILESSFRSLQREADNKITSINHDDADDAQRASGMNASTQELSHGRPAAPTLIDHVLAARAVPIDTQSLLSAAMSNPRIPSEMRAELPGAMAKVQDVSSHAPGITTEYIADRKLGRSSAPGSGGTVWTSTVKSGGHAHGFAYEIIATARFIDAPRTPGNGGKPVQIVKGRDELIFGQKLPAGPGRKTVEADTLIVRAGGHKIAIDSKAYSRPFGTSHALAEELEGIKHAIRQGEVHEFHFASRGGLTPGAKELIEQADRDLRQELAARQMLSGPTISDLQAMQIDLAQPLICWHEGLG